MIEYLGLFGLVLLCLAWIPETIDMIKTKKAYLNKTFIMLYVIGSGSLTIYAYIIHDLVFFLLDLWIAIMALLNGYYELKKEWHDRKQRKHKK